MLFCLCFVRFCMKHPRLKQIRNTAKNWKRRLMYNTIIRVVSLVYIIVSISACKVFKDWLLDKHEFHVDFGAISAFAMTSF